MVSDDIAKLAAGLSKSQKAAVLWCNADGTPREAFKGAPSHTSFWVLETYLRGKPKTEIATVCHITVRGGGFPRGSIRPNYTWSLTSLGLRVRAYLMEQQGQS